MTDNRDRGSAGEPEETQPLLPQGGSDMQNSVARSEDPVQTPLRPEQRPRRVSSAPIGPQLQVEPGADECDERRVVRFSKHQRAQHFIMMASVLLLVFTGMPQKFFDASVSQWMVNFWGGRYRSAPRRSSRWPGSPRRCGLWWPRAR